MAISTAPVADSFFFSKNDPHDLRLGDLAKPVNLEDLSKLPFGWVLLGYPDDEGIQLNGGRVGARLAPDNIRKYFYRMTPSSFKRSELQPAFYDLGNLALSPEAKEDSSTSLAQKHEVAQTLVKQTLDSQKKIFCLGGGHDYGFPDAAAFVEYNIKKSKQRPLVINFDAHLDVRPTDKGFHSGTPFRRLLTQYSQQIDFVEIGIQPQCNSLTHRQWAERHQAVIIDLAHVEKIGLLPALKKGLKSTKSPKFSGRSSQRPLWLSIDIDSFCSSEAPGCSQSFAIGLHIEQFLPALRFLEENFDIQGLGLYEVSPPLDQDDRTSKLAALILYHAVFTAKIGS